MTDPLKLKRLLGLGQVCLCIGVASGALMMMAACVVAGYPKIFVFLGSILLPLSVIVARGIVSDLSLVVDRHAIQQDVLFLQGRLFLRQRLLWNDVESFSRRRATYVFEGGKANIRVNIDLLSDPSEFVALLEIALSPERFAERTMKRLVASRDYVIARWIHVVLIFLSGAWLVFDAPGILSTSPVWAQAAGCTLMLGSLVWCAWVFESGSVTLDSRELTQMRLFRGGGWFTRQRLAWLDVTGLKCSGVILTFNGSNRLVRVDASYFETDDLVDLIADRLPDSVDIPE